MSAAPAKGSTASAQVARLRRERPYKLLLRANSVALVALVVVSWSSGEIDVAELFSSRRAANLQRFVRQDALPLPLREQGFNVGALFDWAWGLIRDPGLRATLATLWISILAIVLAGIFALVTMPLAARTLATREPYLAGEGSAGQSGAGPWRLLVALVRALYVFMRAVPEYVWAFLLMAMLGPSAWPAVLALAIHNGGILGRLDAETVENLEVAPLRSLRMLGASRRQISATALLPLAMPRLLLYFFYRFETCVREATVLGMLGVVSLGYYIVEARSRQFYDEMLLLVALGIVIVLVGDLLSYAARAWVRRAA